MYYDDNEYDEFDGDYLDRVEFADPGGNSSLRASGPNNPRDCDCPTCGAHNVLTREDRRRHYQCNDCADQAEGGFGY